MHAKREREREREMDVGRRIFLLFFLFYTLLRIFLIVTACVLSFFHLLSMVSLRDIDRSSHLVWKKAYKMR